MNREELMVAAIENGTVIDHIPSSKLFEVVDLLRLKDVRSPSSIMVGYNLKSNKMGHKSIIKISNKYFTDAELNLLSLVAPGVSLCIIKDYCVVEKKRVNMPAEVRGIVRCGNPKCITNNEPMDTVFTLADREKRIMQCRYCEKEQRIDTLKLINK